LESRGRGKGGKGEGGGDVTCFPVSLIPEVGASAWVLLGVMIGVGAACWGWDSGLEARGQGALGCCCMLGGWVDV
jgi:hypothetical protein